jgi:hypothetical protein
MPWFISLGLGLLVGFSISNSQIRHHALTLIIWSCKATKYILNKMIWLCEWSQDRFDDIEYIAPQIIQEPKSKDQKQVVKTQNAVPDFSDMDTEKWHKWFIEHPDQVSSKK